ncbi:MAG: aminopeptidase P family N-terminal domain-containing protein [Deltaproteobacteria bacterium]|nr:aminopeptidase P family N-terminal domain-containing protein [Deltaproteobacteria bacterium]
MASSDEIREKERRVREFMGSKGLKALLLKRQANFSWMTGGGLNLVGIATEMGVASLLITASSKFVVCSNIEAPRMAREEKLEEQGYALATFPWHEDSEAVVIKKLAGKGKIGCDAGFPEAEVLAEDIARLRYSLTPEEVERYRWLGERVSMGLEKTMLEARRGEKESEVVARLCGELWKDRIDPITLMSAADDRVSNFRHPIPTERQVEKYLMVSVNARKWGLIVSLTRFLYFGKLPDDLRQKYLANVQIDSAFMAATRPGVPARDVLTQGIEAYRAQGYPDEWKLHHQGGSIGYTGRDYRTNFQTPDIIQDNQGFTWNPSITGTKSEDTILATGKGPEPITRPVLYPVLTVEAGGRSFTRPAVLELS